MSSFLYKNSSFSITKREVGTSITIIGIMVIIGIIISSHISANIDDIQARCDKAVKIDNDSEMFEYGMNTNVGDAFVYGELKAIDTVKDKHLKGDYLKIYRVEEHYCRHTRSVKSGKTYHTKVYYTWDKVGDKTLVCKEVNFCGKNFSSSKFNFSDLQNKGTKQITYNKRYIYYVIEKEIKGTIFTSLKNNTISYTNKFYTNKSINDTLKVLKNRTALYFFIIIWILVTILVVCIFFYIDNKWLE